MKTKTIVFDLDDTLIKEIDYLKSAFYEIASFLDNSNKDSLYQEMYFLYLQQENVFQKLVVKYPQNTVFQLQHIYRNHVPKFQNAVEVFKLLEYFYNKNYKLGIITDGYSVTQRNKIKSLNIIDMLDLVVISEEFGTEKPTSKNYEIFHQFNTDEYYYIGDNFNKDFIAPNKLGWKTIGVLDDGTNIHKQHTNLSPQYLPKITVKQILDIKKHIDD